MGHRACSAARTIEIAAIARLLVTEGHLEARQVHEMRRHVPHSTSERISRSAQSRQAIVLENLVCCWHMFPGCVNEHVPVALASHPHCRPAATLKTLYEKIYVQALQR